MRPRLSGSAAAVGATQSTGEAPAAEKRPVAAVGLAAGQPSGARPRLWRGNQPQRIEQRDVELTVAHCGRAGQGHPQGIGSTGGELAAPLPQDPPSGAGDRQRRPEPAPQRLGATTAGEQPVCLQPLPDRLCVRSSVDEATESLLTLAAAGDCDEDRGEGHGGRYAVALSGLLLRRVSFPRTGLAHGCEETSTVGVYHFWKSGV